MEIADDFEDGVMSPVWTLHEDAPVVVDLDRADPLHQRGQGGAGLEASKVGAQTRDYPRTAHDRAYPRNCKQKVEVTGSCGSQRRSNSA